jgi:alcohol dehydrogenase class IV
LRHHKMLPALAVVDPELTYSTPRDVTAASGMDALAQVLEPFVSVKANPLTDTMCREGLAHAARSLRRVVEDGSDRDARHDMALTSLFGGLALANSGLGAAHGFAGPLGGMYEDAPHGAVVAALLPGVMRANIAALRERQPDSPALHRYEEIARILTGDPGAAAEDGAAWVQSLRDALPIPGLSTYGVEAAHFTELIAKAQRSSSMKGNPLSLTDAELATVLEEAG